MGHGEGLLNETMYIVHYKIGERLFVVLYPINFVDRNTIKTML
jgi:hypothetical protein